MEWNHLGDTEGIIPWYRAAPYMAVTLKKLMQRFLYTQGTVEKLYL
jgi:hypothetical protein